jgi:hypothetical protein
MIPQDLVAKDVVRGAELIGRCSSWWGSIADYRYRQDPITVGDDWTDAEGVRPFRPCQAGYG